jgi:hypothetical protein
MNMTTKAKELIEQVVNGADPSQLVEIASNQVKPGKILVAKKKFIAGGKGTPSEKRSAEWREATGKANDLWSFSFDTGTMIAYKVEDIDHNKGFVKFNTGNRMVYCGTEDLVWFREPHGEMYPGR